MVIYSEILEPTKSSPHTAVRWSPAESDYSPVCGLLTIDTRRARSEYVVTEFVPGWRGRAFVMEKVGGTESYAVFCSADGPEADSCDCLGGERWGRCKHRGAIRALIQNGWL